MLTVLCFSDCPLKFLGKKWGLEENSPIFGTKIMEIFNLFNKSTKIEEICNFIPDFVPKKSEKKEISCYATIPPDSVSFSLESQNPEKSVWGEGVKCVLKINKNSEEAISKLKTEFQKILIGEKESDF